MSDWLELLCTGTSESEAPERWFWWAGLATIAAAVGKNVFLDRHYYKLSPNIYVAIISARPGQRKGVPISICKGILEDTDRIRIISGCNSIQAVITELSKQKTFESGAVEGKAQAILISDEFSTLLVEDPRSLKDLIALYNPWEHKKWEKNLKSSGKETLKEPCLNMLVASNQTLFDDTVKSTDRDGGFMSRTFIVFESKDRRSNSLVYAPKQKLDKEELVRQLIEIGKIQGEFKFTSSAGKYYEKWYDKFKLESAQLDDPTGTLGRFTDSILKVAMLISLSRTSDLLLTDELIHEAIGKCESCLSAVNITSLTGNGESETSQSVGKVIKLLIEAVDQTLSRQKILQKLNLKGVDSVVLDRVIETLIQANAIQEPYRDETKKIIYSLKREVYDKYMGFKSEIQ